MNWTSLAGTLAQFGLTGLGTLFGGPLGGAVGNEVGKAIAGALGVEATPEAVEAAIKADPELAKARLADLESARQADVERARIEAGDVKDARETMVELVQAESPLAWGPVVISAVILLMAGAVFGAVMLGKLPDSSLITGAAISWVTAVIGYWIGSSSGSKRMGDAVRSVALSANSPSPAQIAGAAIGGAIRQGSIRQTRL